jgi:4-amino-4-deoxy-L-arabinose transferase-like glycosyltransferase
LQRLRFPACLALVVALAATLSFYRLGAADVCSFNEAVEGVFVQQMVEHGELLFPLDNDRAPLYKPPLFHWTATALDRIVGAPRVTAFNLRMPAALYAIAGVALTMVFANDLLGLSGALVAGLVLCGSYQYIENARIGRVDMTLCFFETLAMFAMAWWLAAHGQAQAAAHADTRPASTSSSDAALRYLMGAALGLAMLSKGPVGAFLPATAGALFLLSERRFSDLRRLASPGPVALAVVIGTSWYAACYFSGRYGFLQRQLGSENLGRFFGTLGVMAPWYYLKPLLFNSFPFSLIAPFVVYAALRSGREPATRETVAVRLFAVFWLVTVVFFSVAAYKRRAYLLPLWPVSAVMLAWAVTAQEDARKLAAEPTGRDHRGALFTRPRVLRGALLLACGAMIVFNFFYLPRQASRSCGADSLRAAAAEINRIVGRDEPLYSYKLGAEPATLLFYLDRTAPPIMTRLGDAPPGYVIVPRAVWQTEKDSAPAWTPVFESTSGDPRIVLLRHGAALAEGEICSPPARDKESRAGRTRGLYRVYEAD